MATGGIISALAACDELARWARAQKQEQLAHTIKNSSKGAAWLSTGAFAGALLGGWYRNLLAVSHVVANTYK